MSVNPFAALLDTSSDTGETVSAKTCENQLENESFQYNRAVENIFLVTINNKIPRDKSQPVVYLEELAERTSELYIDKNLLEQAVFERILLGDPKNYVIPQPFRVNSDVCETKVLMYLFKSYQRVLEGAYSEEIKETSRSIIIRNVILALQQPELFQDQELPKQLFECVTDASTVPENFFAYIAENLTPGDGSASEMFLPLLKLKQADAVKSTLVDVDSYIYRLLEIFTSNEIYANVFLDHCTPSNLDNGIEYANSLLGALLNTSILPKTLAGKFEYFDKVTDMHHSIVETNLGNCTARLHTNLHTVFLKLLKCSKEIRNRTLTWLARCLKANLGRGKLWNAHSMEFTQGSYKYVADGFMINFANVVLRLCEPFCSDVKSGKILKVDPTYAAVPENEREAKEVHMYQLHSETCLIPASTDEDSPNSEGSTAVRPTANSYNFVTECFFMTHRALDLGFRISVDHLVRMNQDIAQIQRAYNDAVNQSSGSSDVLDTIKARLEDSMTKYMSLRAVLLESNQLQRLCEFHQATATWLTQVVMRTKLPRDGSTYAPGIFRPVTFPLPDTVPDTLKCIPEFVIENTVGYLSFLRRFSPQAIETRGYDFLDPILTMVLVFMGSTQRMRNPHLRARMAECLEALLPTNDEAQHNLYPMGNFQRERLFKEHPYRKEIVPTLLEVFVGIEMTGQSVQFEQKFNYRRPMYIVMDYLWQLEEHRKYFKQLAIEAEENMEAVSPPLFLRFVNLLMNDAVFLLDESLSNMAQLRNMQTARESGEWDNLPPEERVQNMSYMQHIGMIARFDNILGRETIHTLELLTSEITTVFTHSTMVDRVAAMLNYFLFNLVGPKKKNFKVKDLKEYEFDPANTVLNICKIYVHLYESDSFCLAISQDGRSYSPQLFSLAEDVLARIGGGALISELRQVAAKVSELASEHQAQEEVLAEAPDEFLDPIMSTLMTDPVILPSSKQVVDRTTIARHLLSDQTDPFNRSPLTMDQIIPHKELADRIKQWIEERKSRS